MRSNYHKLNVRHIRYNNEKGIKKKHWSPVIWRYQYAFFVLYFIYICKALVLSLTDRSDFTITYLKCLSLSKAHFLACISSSNNSLRCISNKLWVKDAAIRRSISVKAHFVLKLKKKERGNDKVILFHTVIYELFNRCLCCMFTGILNLYC